MPVYAEVSDKMASISHLWIQGFVGAIILFVLIRWSIWFSILGVVIVFLFSVISYQTLSDPFVGTAIIKEQGTPYIFATYGSVLLMAVGCLAGLILNRKRNKHRI